MQDTIAIVTGAASGIGLATAEAFAVQGTHVILMDRDGERLHDIAEKFGSSATSICGDVSQSADCRRAAAATLEVGLPLSALVNCAASFLAKGEAAEADDWDTSLGTNVKGTALMASASVPVMRQTGGGAIVNLASISGYIAQPNRWTYNATKGAILALTRCQALDLASDGIRVNSVSPGTIWTPELDRMTGYARAEWEPLLGAQHMLNRVGEPAEVARAITFLCGPSASFITGTDLVVDGGYLAMGHDRDETAIKYSSD
ncbi:MAG: hypothetical protein QOH76_2704 [Thermoleophilaceae bacterium]|jgi:NAD(P)-dependent dehydrogenase (short-subunit alcohol dehydrogenase family)|nr:hypothetical protein [Thermoleophilaceae bacterium]